MPPREGPDLESLFALFPPAEDVGTFQRIPGEEVPPPYHGLLLHEHHMTVTVEAHHGRLVDVKILQVRKNQDVYARKILLALQGSGRVVQFGIMRVHLSFCDDKVKQEILAERTPLGRILIEHNVLRRVEPTAFLRIDPGQTLTRALRMSKPIPLYGRTGVIFCDDRPAIAVLEVPAPV